MYAEADFTHIGQVGHGLEAQRIFGTFMMSLESRIRDFHVRKHLHQNSKYHKINASRNKRQLVIALSWLCHEIASAGPNEPIMAKNPVLFKFVPEWYA